MFRVILLSVMANAGYNLPIRHAPVEHDKHMSTLSNIDSDASASSTFAVLDATPARHVYDGGDAQSNADGGGAANDPDSEIGVMLREAA